MGNTNKFQVGERVRIDNPLVANHAPYRHGDEVSVLAIRTFELNDGAERNQYLISGGEWVPEFWLASREASSPERVHGVGADLAGRFAYIDERLAGLLSICVGFQELFGMFGGDENSMLAALTRRIEALEAACGLAPDKLAEGLAERAEEPPAEFRITGPGKYRTRNGKDAVVSHHDDTSDEWWPWAGTLAGLGAGCWREDGRWRTEREDHPNDLVERIGDLS